MSELAGLRQVGRRVLPLALMCLCSVALAQTRPAISDVEARVEIAGGTLSSSPDPLVGTVFVPAGAGQHPAVVMMHGCGGAYVRDGSLNARHRMWGEYLAAHGYLALMLDSFTSRGVKELCTQKFSERKLKQRDRVGDAYAALAYLRRRPDVDPMRIALLGWSHGGGSVLEAIGAANQGGPGYSAAVAFYPSCTGRAKGAALFHPYAPLLILIGEADDWTPAASCVSLTDSGAARGEPMRIVTYPGTYHDFDNPGRKTLTVRQDVPNGVHPGRGVTVAPNAQAREDAKKRVLEFLAEMDVPPKME